ncbi:unnamed protein product [Angiostrongylus costaricensis]|uniref:PfkB domain-containing protein n=1 Tax=Angiostrongylus costaricensis TaxID=334426 RepID=A0A0R3PX13_ANGCS|nr:unnamed protein product [Angiostrongylus costaricensis]
MFLANIAGIRVFATGGIGGVHRGAEQTFDVSADLLELSHTPLTVVCAGVKSILDISKTVEFLETHSVNCIVFGERNVFPGFFSRESHAKGQFNTENLAEVVEHIETSKALGLNAGMILACPIPKEMEDDGNAIEAAVQMALNEARIKGIQSKEVTPFLLSRVNELTCGASVKLNIALLENNARIAGKLASLLSKSKLGQNFRVVRDNGKDSEQKSKAKIVVVGATIIDFESITNEDVKISKHENVISSADFVFFDGNIPTETIRKILDLSAFYNRKVWFDPTSISKMRKIFDCEGMNQIQVVSPNANEFMDMVKRSRLRITHGIVFEGFDFSLNSGILAGLVNGLPLERCLQIGQACAARSLLSVETISPSISPEIISS